jgi:hypothetical protein
MKKYGEWTEKRWMEYLNFLICSGKFTSGSIAADLAEKKRHLELCGDYDNLPSNIKINIAFYSSFANYIHEYPRVDKQSKSVKRKIEIFTGVSKDKNKIPLF